MPFVSSVISAFGEKEKIKHEGESTTHTPVDNPPSPQPRNTAQTRSVLSKSSQVLLSSTDDGISAIEELKTTMESIAAAAEESAGAAEEGLGAVNDIKKSTSEILKLSTATSKSITKLEGAIHSSSFFNKNYRIFRKYA
jgi:methyl-accepting chemotaxis protein